MATIKELQAKFTSNASGMESAFTAMANKLNDIEKASSRAASSMEKNMSRGMNRVFKTGEGFEKVGNTLDTISKKSTEMGSSLTNKITKPALVAGGALAGITIGKGFGRLVEIDNAKAKLDGLGHSGKGVQSIMDNALESVKGTSFGLGEAATTASSAVAAGIKPGKELVRYLSLTGDAAAIAGSSMGEMGSIINKVQTANKAYNGELQQLSERGIPIYQWIAKEAGVTADEVFKMASDGEISSKIFLNAIETNIGGAAKKMGQKSFTAAMANMWSAVGRLGASFLDAGGKGGGFFSKMKPLMLDLTNSIDGMEGAAAKWGETLGQVLDKIVNGIKGIVNWYNSLDKNTQKLIASIMKWSTLILVGLGPVLTIFGKLTGIIATIFGPFGKFLKFFAKFSTASKSAEGALIGITKVFPRLGAALGLMTGPVGWITLAVVALGTAFVVAYKKSDRFREIVNGAFEIVKVFSVGIGKALIGKLKDLGKWLGDVGNKAKDFGKNFYDSWSKTEVGKKRIDEWNKLKDVSKKVFDAIASGGKRATDTSDALGKGVSKATKKALGAYVDLSEKASTKLAELTLSGENTTKNQLKDFKSLTDGMQKELEAQLDKRRKAQLDNMQAIFNDNKSAPERFKIDAEAQEKYIKSIQDTNDKEKKEAEKLFADYEKIRDKAFDDGVVTPEEQKKINESLDQLNKFTVETLSKSEKEQMTILGRLQKNKEALSMKEAQDVVKKSVKLRDQRIKDADEEYQDELDRIAQSEQLSDEDRKKALGAAKQKWLDAKGMAENTHNDVLKEVKSQYKNIGNEQDLQTGKAYSSAEKWWNSFKKGFTDFFSAENINGLLTSLGTLISKPFIALGRNIAKWWNQGLTESSQSFTKLGDFLSRIAGGVGSFFTRNSKALVDTGKRIWSLIKQGWSIAYGGGAWVVNFLWNMLKRMGSTISNGARWLWQGLKTAWDQSKQITFTTWSWISGFFKNIWNGLWTTVRNVGSWIMNKVRTSWDFVKGKTLAIYTWVKNFLYNTWTSIWTNIRNFATWIGNKIRGTWDYVRNKTLSTYNWIKNFLFNTWQSIWGTIKNVANWIWTKVSSVWNAVRSKTLTIYNWIRNFLFGIWNSIWNKIKTTAIWIWNKIRTTWDNIRNKTSNIFNSIWGIIKRIWNYIWGYIRDTVNRIRNKVVGVWETIQKKMSGIVNSIKNNVVNRFKDMYNGAKKWVDKIGDYISGATKWMADKASALGIGVANAAIRGLNKMISGINKISKGITDKNLIDPINEIGSAGTIGAKLSTGTGASKQVKTDNQGRLRQNTLATVNDKGPGNGKGRNGYQELIRNKNGSMFAPKGKDVLMKLKKGQSVISGRETQSLSSTGLIPRFNSGTGALGKIGGDWGAKLLNTAHQTEDKAENATMAIKVAKDAGVKTGASELGKGIGNVMEWVDKPKELVETMMRKMGVNFGDIAGGTGKLVRGAYNKLIPSLIDKVKDMFTEVEGGDGDASWLLNGKYPQLQPFGHYVGMTMNGTSRHYGLDFGMPTGTKIRALTAGKISQAGWSPYGGGNQITLDEPGGKWFQWYMHMSKIIAKKGQSVSAGDVIGLSGNTGSSSTPHLHIQRMKGYPSNDTAVDPTNWLKSLTGGGSGSGKWKSTVKKALALSGLPVTPAYINAWMKQIQTESGGNARAIGGTDGLADGRATGLVQVKPGTFNAYKGNGMGSILNPLHNLVAGMNYSKSRYGKGGLLNVIGRGHGYAEGGIINSPEIAWLAEGGFSESVISHDPSMRARSKVLYDRTGEMLGFNEDAELLREVITLIDKTNKLQSINNRDTNRIANKDTNVYMDGDKVTKKVSQKQGSIYNNNAYVIGGG
ncbi:peptidoglycan DD-metalloendopeptidase family protein [Mammaliicoccus fleurettii]|uniref:peptidoglycan DD-metalloendopeptidase family protein n=1 Tax=Mammaliicoccus fleurettii TaxID=150056 RepID=UPI001AADA7A0|nr:peptidoglycan DD-metalloendopeptidase family protein [Mammaliicoccus fleurettii]MBO3062715.1 peptidoglycan DD-metalloendopeptidase family protein [Mammaliicoccus fleurettii]